MAKLSSADFEKECRKLCVQAFERKSASDNPVRKQLEGKLGSNEALEYWSNLWEHILQFNQLLLPRVLEGCGDVDARVDLWSMVHAEFGRGIMASSRPWLFKAFLTALGGKLDDFKFVPGPYPNTALQKKQQQWESMTFVELLAVFLCRESVAPQLFERLAEALMANFHLKAADVKYFTVRHDEGKAATEKLFKLISRYADTEEKQDRVRKTIDQFYRQEHYVQYCSAIGRSTYDFVKPETSRAGKRSEQGIPFLLEANGKRFEGTTIKINQNGVSLPAKGYDLVTHSLVTLHLMDPSSDRTHTFIGTVVRMFDDASDAETIAAIEFDAVRTLKHNVTELISEAKMDVEAPDRKQYGA